MKPWIVTFAAVLTLGLIQGCGDDKEPAGWCNLDPRRSFSFVRATPARMHGDAEVAYCANIDIPVTGCAVEFDGTLLWCEAQ
jgi:hypothetical protein